MADAGRRARAAERRRRTRRGGEEGVGERGRAGPVVVPVVAVATDAEGMADGGGSYCGRGSWMLHVTGHGHGAVRSRPWIHLRTNLRDACV